MSGPDVVQSGATPIRCNPTEKYWRAHMFTQQITYAIILAEMYAKADKNNRFHQYNLYSNMRGLCTGVGVTMEPN